MNWWDLANSLLAGVVERSRIVSSSSSGEADEDDRESLGTRAGGGDAIVEEEKE